MDHSQMNPAVMNNPNPFPGIAPQQLQRGAPMSNTSLPPLQANNPPNMYTYGPGPQTPRTPATPNTPSNNSMGNFAQSAAQPRNFAMMPNAAYQQQPQAYRTSSSMLAQTSTAMSFPQPIAPAPLQNRIPQPLRPMPPNGLPNIQGGMHSPYGNPHLLGHLPEMEQPTHVVGSQGRRGILPSAPGRPPVATTANGKAALMPTKDADGKFPCPHCTKTYLHAKHLKRHLLRHTGDRPYMCILCRDTFSRSDILKRHFQKCSIRRGNPTGASHLSHAQAHLKKSQPGPHKSTDSIGSEGDMMGVNGLASLGSGMSGHFGISPDGTVPDAGQNLTEEQAQHLRQANSMKRLSGGGHSMAGYAAAMAGPMPSGMISPDKPIALFGENSRSYSQGYDLTSRNMATNGQIQLPVLQHSPSTYQHPNFIAPDSAYASHTQSPINSEPIPANFHQTPMSLQGLAPRSELAKVEAF